MSRSTRRSLPLIALVVILLTSLVARRFAGARS